MSNDDNKSAVLSIFKDYIMFKNFMRETGITKLYMVFKF